MVCFLLYLASFSQRWPMKFIYPIACNTNSFSLLYNIPLCEYAQFVYPFIAHRY